MPETLILTSLRRGYRDVCELVLDQGREVAPRGQQTRELPSVSLRILDPVDSLPLAIGRGVAPRLAAAEAIQLIGGFSAPELLAKVAPNVTQFAEDDGHYHGAYGPRVGPQLPAVIQRLREDPDTRQAVVVLWKPELDLLPGMRDYPCTIALQFLIRDGRLELHVHMRSNDVWWGLAYDVFQFTQLQLTVAKILQRPAGDYYHHATSLHIYSRDYHKVRELERPDAAPPRDLPRGLRLGSIESVTWLARLIVFGVPGANRPEMRDPSHRWYFDQVGGYVAQP